MSILSERFSRMVESGKGYYAVVAAVNREALAYHEAVTVLRNGPRILAACQNMFAAAQQERLDRMRYEQADRRINHERAG